MYFVNIVSLLLPIPDHLASNGLNRLIKDSLVADILSYLSPKEAISRTFVLSSQTGKPSLYFDLKRRLDSLSAVYLQLQTKTTEEGLIGWPIRSKPRRGIGGDLQP